MLLNGMRIFFDSECTGDEDNSTVFEKLIKYYNPGNKLIESVYTITGKDKRPLKSKCLSDYDYPYKITNDITTYLKTNNIRYTK